MEISLKRFTASSHERYRQASVDAHRINKLDLKVGSLRSHSFTALTFLDNTSVKN